MGSPPIVTRLLRPLSLTYRIDTRSKSAYLEVLIDELVRDPGAFELKAERWLSG